MKFSMLKYCIIIGVLLTGLCWLNLPCLGWILPIVLYQVSKKCSLCLLREKCGHVSYTFAMSTILKLYIIGPRITVEEATCSDFDQ